ncbi:MarR family transcriptional regulator [Holzapfeliella floricola]|uniref:MarR family transcriptional regulator n=1 Tax=Holzapfeliella floricola TaxID=679249 RepID=UPI000782F067|nr:helix-turn-helix domain-containing protein [Holzapfeliella floricola]
MSKTVRELSEELGVSKTTINKLLKDESRQQYVEKVGNKFVISDEGVESITAHFANSDSPKSKAKPKAQAKPTSKKEELLTKEEAQDTEVKDESEDLSKVTELEAELEQAKAELEKNKRSSR